MTNAKKCHFCGEDTEKGVVLGGSRSEIWACHKCALRTFQQLRAAVTGDGRFLWFKHDPADYSKSTLMADDEPWKFKAADEGES